MKSKLLTLMTTLAATAAFAAPLPKTLLEFRGSPPAPATLHDAVLVIVDAQREYFDGQLPLHGIDAAITADAALLARARAAGTPVIHIVQHSPGPLFNPGSPGAEIVAPLAPRPGETIIVKTLPDSFAGTTLDLTLRKIGRRNLILVGFMTHMCISATAHSALDLSYHATVVAAGCATRDIPDGHGGIIPADVVHRAHLAALADRFATVVADPSEIAD